MSLAVLYGALAVKRHVSTATTVEALFTGVKRSYLHTFTLHPPQQASLLRSFTDLEGKLLRLLRAANPHHSEFPEAAGFREMLRDRFTVYDPMVARALSALESALGRPTKASPRSETHDRMLTLSIHLNHLLTWVSTVFSVSLAAGYIASHDSNSYVAVLTFVNAIVSCFSGFFISSYLITRIEEALSQQILTVFQHSRSDPTANQDDEETFQPRETT